MRFSTPGRARSLEEAILWHDGEGRDARERFSALSRADRLTLVRRIDDL
jgi:CxxC motif-containing protein (DUF1111 family)